MAQTKKEDIERRILASAKKEFIKKGFHESSLRTIAKNAGISLANIYNYYRSKDEVFYALVSKLVNDLDSLESHFRNYQPVEIEFDPLELELARADAAAVYIFNHRTEFNLLFSKSAGSSLDGYGEKLILGYVENCRSFISFLKSKGVPIPYIPSDFFFVCVGRLFLAAAREAVESKKTLEEMKKYAEELTRYNSFGFHSLSSLNQNPKGDNYVSKTNS